MALRAMLAPAQALLPAVLAPAAGAVVSAELVQEQGQERGPVWAVVPVWESHNTVVAPGAGLVMQTIVQVPAAASAPMAAAAAASLRARASWAHLTWTASCAS